MRHLIFSLFLIGSISGCATKDVSQNISVKPQTPVSISDKDKASFMELQSLMQAQQFEKALVLIQKLLVDYPLLPELHVNKGVALLRQSKTKEAVVEFERATSINDELAQAHSFLGEAFLAQGQIKRAEQSYLKALALAPDTLYAHYGLGVIYDLYLFDFDKAERHYLAFLEGA
ncbi:tetratricopeptide repeat protein, partial [Oleiphilus sp. HI0067]